MSLPSLPIFRTSFDMASAMRAGELRRKSRTFLRISASQIESFDEAGAGGGGCKRKWWSGSVAGIREPATSAQAFGTVLHSVIERFLEADDLGYAPGAPGREPEPVNLYPRGWERPVGRDGKPQPGGLFADEQDLVKGLISKAIESGILSRRVGRKVEAPIYLPVLDPTDTLPGVGLSGFADLIHMPTDLADESPEAWEVQDHKTCKNRRYAKTEATLRTNHQVNIYAKWLLEEARKAGANPKTIRVRHNNYPKSPKASGKPDEPWVVNVDLTVDQIEAHWVRIQHIAHEMRVARARAFRFTDLDMPESSAPCGAYGGCPLFTVCGAGKPYEAHVAELQGRHSAPVFRQEVRAPAPADRAGGGVVGSVLSAPLPRGPVGPKLPGL